MSKRRRGWPSVAFPLAVVLLLQAAPAAAQTPDPNNPITAASVARVKRALADPPRAKLDAGPQEPLPTFPEQPYWTRRRVAIWSGVAAAGVAATFAWFKEKELRDIKSDLEALPPGSNDAWAEMRDEADKVMKERNFWMAAAIGVGGVTAAYAIALRNYDIPIIGPPRGSKPGSRASTVRLRPMPRGVTLLWNF
jgi:hypothetical protein